MGSAPLTRATPRGVELDDPDIRPPLHTPAQRAGQNQTENVEYRARQVVQMANSAIEVKAHARVRDLAQFFIDKGVMRVEPE